MPPRLRTDTESTKQQIDGHVVPSVVGTLRKRSDYIRVATGRKVVTSGFILQIYVRNEPNNAPRVGFTCSKKVGNAVARNRAKRRLRELARAVLPRHARRGTDYVLIGRANVTATRPFAVLIDDLRTALDRAQ
ncbi:MAG: ribonuclease P protein component [Pseudomonadota bacterium]